jgi:maleate cis-trans isomerase
MMASTSDQRWINLLRPRFRLGNIYPRHETGARRGTGYQLYHLVPIDVMEVGISLGIAEYTAGAVQQALPNLWACVDALAAEKVDCMILGGAPVSAQLGRPRVRQLLAEVKERTGIPMEAPLEAILAGLNHLGAKKVAIGSRWADELNNALAGYLREGGIDVLAVTTRGQWNAEAHRMTFDEGLQVALDVGREAARLAPNADAIIVPGGAAFSIHVIPALEEELGLPTLTNLNAEVWSTMVRTGVIDPVKGWGRLLASR